MMNSLEVHTPISHILVPGKNSIAENLLYWILTSEVTPLATQSFKKAPKLAILPDYKRSEFLCQALPSRQKLDLMVKYKKIFLTKICSQTLILIRKKFKRLRKIQMIFDKEN